MFEFIVFCILAGVVIYLIQENKKFKKQLNSQQAQVEPPLPMTQAPLGQFGSMKLETREDLENLIKENLPPGLDPDKVEIRAVKFRTPEEAQAFLDSGGMGGDSPHMKVIQASSPAEAMEKIRQALSESQEYPVELDQQLDEMDSKATVQLSSKYDTYH